MYLDITNLLSTKLTSCAWNHNLAKNYWTISTKQRNDTHFVCFKIFRLCTNTSYWACWLWLEKKGNTYFLELEEDFFKFATDKQVEFWAKYDKALQTNNKNYNNKKKNQAEYLAPSSKRSKRSKQGDEILHEYKEKK